MIYKANKNHIFYNDRTKESNYYGFISRNISQEHSDKLTMQ